MPEIAEVAIMSKTVEQVALNKHLHRVTVIGGRYHGAGRQLPRLDALNAALPLRVTRVATKGKKCWIEVEDKYVILVSFGMTGAFYKAIPTNETDAKHVHIQLALTPSATDTTNISTLYYGDMRRFGTWHIYDDRSEFATAIDAIGPDLYTVTQKQFIAIARTGKFATQNVCKFLLEQKAISGVGAYIRTESLYRARISPWASMSALNDEALSDLHTQLLAVATDALNATDGDAPLYGPTGSRVDKQSFVARMKVYGKKTDPEGRTITKSKTPDNRTTHWVAEVQTRGYQAM